MSEAVLGIIGGSGIYDLPGISDLREERIDSPWGEPSDALRIGRIGKTKIVFLPRHGRGHAIPPSEINYRANIDVLKRAGVTDLVSLSACGSYRAELYPGLFVLVDQFVDRTSRRESSFFGKGCVAHVSVAHPVGPALQSRIAAAAEAEELPFVRGGTLVTMEGPQFSTYAESMTYRGLGYDLIGMTAMPEAKLAREAEITYATVAMVTDYRLLAPSSMARSMSPPSWQCCTKMPTRHAASSRDWRPISRPSAKPARPARIMPSTTRSSPRLTSAIRLCWRSSMR